MTPHPALRDERTAARMEEMFMDDLARSREITLRKWFKRSAIERLKEKIAGVFRQQL
jgi:hypothetical protein